jgi:hypothetical protein
MTRAEIRATEARRAIPVATATFLAVVLLVVSGFVSGTSGSGDAEILRSVHEHASSVTVSAILQAIAFALLAVPLYYLFQAARARSDRVRSQLVGLVIVAPLFLALSSGLAAGARQEAADQFIAGEAKSTLSKKEANEKCLSDRKEEGAKEFAEEFEPAKGETALAACERRKVEDDEASNAIGEVSLAPVVSGLGIAGGLGLAISLFYSCLWAMRTGLLTRFWGSLGMALGIAALLGLILFTLIWFIYFGLLVLGWLPGGRPPAWEAGEAIPWPTPGEKAAAELEPSEGDERDEPGSVPEESETRRKRKQRDNGQSE